MPFDLNEIEVVAKASYTEVMNKCQGKLSCEQIYVLGFIRGAIYGVEDARKIAKDELA